MLVKHWIDRCDIFVNREKNFHNKKSAMSPAMNPTLPPPASVPDPPPPPPLPHTATESLPIIPPGTSVSTPATPTVGSPNKSSLKLCEPGMRRQSSFSSLLQKFATDQHFAIDWLERDDDCESIVSVDSCASVGSSLSGNLSRQGSYVDVQEAVAASGATAKPGLTTSSVAQLDKKLEGVKLEPNRKKLSQAMIWTWLSSAKQNPLPEDIEVSNTLPKTLANASEGQDPRKDVKINTEKLRAKLVKTYPKYYRDLNATSPNNW